MENLLPYLLWIWLGVALTAIIVEICTTTLVSVWFAVGALAAMVASALGAPFAAQIAVFLALSILVLALARPLAKRFLAPRTVPTNADRVLGMTARVTETIENQYGQGAVYVDGKTWSARSAGGERIPRDQEVEVAAMEGVKLIVRPLESGSDKS